MFASSNYTFKKTGRLLLCYSYEVPRLDFLNSVSAIMLPYGLSSASNKVPLKYMLYGDERFTFEANQKLLQATLKFIHATERF